jgi:hypothetical protein
VREHLRGFEGGRGLMDLEAAECSHGINAIESNRCLCAFLSKLRKCARG